MVRRQTRKWILKCMRLLKLVFITLFIIDIYALVFYKQSDRRVRVFSEGKVEAVHSVQPTPAPRTEASYGIASWYDRRVCTSKIYGVSCRTADGSLFDETKFTLACDSRFSLGTGFHLCYLGKCVDAVCNDRGGFAKYGRLFDLSRGTFDSLADTYHGIIKVSWEIKK